MYASHWRPLLFGLAAGCVVFLTLCPCEATAADWKERLLSEAPRKWVALERYYAQMEASFRRITTETPTSMDNSTAIAYLDIRKNGEWMVATIRRVGKFSNGKPFDVLDVNCVNSRYAFKLLKKTPNDETFILANFERAGDQIRQNVHNHGEVCFGIVFEVCISSCVRLVKFIEDPYATITGVHSVRRDGREMAQLNYDYKLMKRDQLIGTAHGTVLLDPQHCWCVREHHSDAPGFTVDEFMEYGDDVDGFPILRRERHTTTYKNGTGKLAVITEFDKLVHREFPESEFTLSAFGLPEMQLPGDQTQRTLWRWLLGIGIALGVLAILTRAYAKRRGRLPQST